MDIKLGDPEANFTLARQWTAEAAQRGSELIVFPELWSSGYDLENWQKHASPLGQGMFASLSDLAAEFKIGIAGSILEARNGKAYNTLTLFDAKGEQQAVYRKVHLFRLMQEEKWLAPGEESVLVETNWGKTGFSDLLRPTLRRTLSQICVGGREGDHHPRRVAARRAAHWQTLLRARAIENQMFIIAVNRVGESKGEIFGGHSAVIDPWGEAIVEGDDHQSLLHAEIDMGLVDEVRKRIPIFEDRREDVYRDE